MRRITGGCDGTLELYLEKYVGRISDEERRGWWRDKTSGTNEPSTMPIIVSRSLEGESTVVFSDILEEER